MPPLVYHGSHPHAPECLAPRPVTNLSSVGTWFTSTPWHARTYYGPVVREYDLPPGRYLWAYTRTRNWSLFWLDLDLAERALGRADFRHVLKHPPEKGWRERLRRMEEEGLAPDATRREAIAWRDRWKEEAALRRTDGIVEGLMRDPDYMGAFRAALEDDGYDGIVWEDSGIDLRRDDPPHTVWVVFNREPLCPVGLVD
jgi:hypothetical protein